MLIKRVWNRIKPRFVKPKTNYMIDGLNIELSNNHMLATYQHSFCYYDRILPAVVKLASEENTDHWIIDIGANVGDTLFSMIKHSQANFLCIEPDKEFYRLLEKNISTLPSTYKEHIYCLNAFVVLDTFEKIKLEKKSGTAHKVVSNDTTNTTPSFKLKEIIDQYKIAPEKIGLIKVDTDGFDWECILSLEELLKATDGYIYWENQLDKDNIKQRQGYIELVRYLEEAGYEDFFCFDNFGNYIAHGNGEFLIEINNYLDRMNNKKTARTFYYVDVLACKRDRVQTIKKMLNDFYC